MSVRMNTHYEKHWNAAARELDGVASHWSNMVGQRYDYHPAYEAYTKNPHPMEYLRILTRYYEREITIIKEHGLVGYVEWAS